MSAQDVIKETGPKMDQVVEDFKRKLSNIRTGRATVGLLDAVVVDYYGTPTPLNQMASVAVPEPQMMTVQPWDATAMAAIEKAIIAANLGLNPSNDGKIIRLTIPALNEERRKQFAKQVHESCRRAPHRCPQCSSPFKRSPQENAQGQRDLRGRGTQRSRRRPKIDQHLSSPRSTSYRKTKKLR